MPVQSNAENSFSGSLLLKSFFEATTEERFQTTSNFTKSFIQPEETFDESQNSIYTQFKLDTVRFIDEDADLSGLLKSYSAICAENSQFLKGRLENLNINRQKELYHSIQLEQEELYKEKNLWDLIYLLYLDEQNAKRNQNEDTDMEVNNNSYETVNEAAIVRNLERKNPLLRRIKIVLRWLENISKESASLKVIKEKMSGFAEKCSGWEHTLHQLKNVNVLHRKEKSQFSGRDLINELDPDAPIRQNKPLHDLDQEDEYKLMEYIFAFVRAGDTQSARDFCFKVGQSWRAATLEGFKYFSDENYAHSDAMYNRVKVSGQQHEVFKNEGNLNRDIWRLVVYRLIKDEHFSPYEKAVYASLAGFVSPVVPVCKSYMDFIWIYFKALYVQIIEKEIRQKITVRDFVPIPYDIEEDHLFSVGNNTSKSSSSPSSSSSPTNLPTIAQIFDRIRVLINNAGNSHVGDSTMNSSVLNSIMSSQVIASLKADAQRPFSVILKHVIVSGLAGFETGTAELSEYLKNLLVAEAHNGLLLRFCSHLALFLRSASLPIHTEAFIQINDLYAQYLISRKYKEIIAYYLSQLTSELQISRYSKFLQSITDNKERIMLLKLAKERNMNVQAITLNIVENLNRTSNSNMDATVSSFLLNQTATGAGSFRAANETTILAIRQTAASTTQQTLNDEDLAKINAIDWIVYDSTQRLRLLEYANLSMRYFLLERQNLDAGKTVYAKIPSDTMATVLAEYNFSKDGSLALNSTLNHSDLGLQAFIENLPRNVANVIKEYLCFKEYIDAIGLYNEWFEFFHKEKPVKPKHETDAARQTSGNDQQSFAERMAHDYQLKQYEDLSNRWYSKALLYSEKVRVKLLSVLKFPVNGWMVDIDSDRHELIDDDEDENENESNMDEDTERSGNVTKIDGNTRAAQLNGLRKFYLPNICFLLADMLNKMNLNKELIRLSDLVASENYKLYNLFEKQQMRSFLKKISNASITLLDSNIDYLGYN